MLYVFKGDVDEFADQVFLCRFTHHNSHAFEEEVLQHECTVVISALKYYVSTNRTVHTIGRVDQYFFSDLLEFNLASLKDYDFLS